MERKKSFEIPQEWIDKYHAVEDQYILNGHGTPATLKGILTAEDYGKIGIGITTHNRVITFFNTLAQIGAHLPPNNVIAIVDDASDKDYITDAEQTTDVLMYRFESNVGIAQAKNKCFELLYNAGCDHIFLFDDDTYPLANEWWKPYIESREPHLMYIFKDFTSGQSPHDMVELYRDNEIVAYSHVRGCMLYYKRECLSKVGGMDVNFGKWGHEHGDLSNRIYSAGLTRFRYMDVVNSKGLFYAADEQEHGKFVSTVPGKQRIDLLNKTKSLYDMQYNLPAYREFRTHTPASHHGKPLFLSAYFTSLPDPQRDNKTHDFFMPDFASYAGSIRLNHGNSVLLIDAQVSGLDTKYLKTQQVQISINPYFQRWFSYYEYLIKHRKEISWIFMTDCTDVELLKMPEPQQGKIYTGDEPGSIGASYWLHYHHKHPLLMQFYRTHGHYQMLNAGILGGYIDDVLPFIRAIIDTYSRMMHESATKRVAGPGMTDMAIFNYVGHTMFADKISHGKHVNTTFKANERNDISWFKHK